MEAPDKIYLSVEKGEDWAYAMWTQKSPEEQKFSELDKHEEYIRKDTLMKWLNARVNDFGHTTPFRIAIQCTIDKINSL